MLFCEDHRERGERVAATRVSINGNRPYCDECWVSAPWAAKSAGFMPLDAEGKPVPASKVGQAGTAGQDADHRSAIQREEGTMGHHHLRKRIEIDENELRRLVGQGFTDKQVGEKLGCSSPVIRRRRIALGLKAHGRGRRALSNRPAIQHKATTRAAVASRGADFRKYPQSVAQVNSIRTESNGHGTLVKVRVEVLDAMWNGLEPQEKAQLLNQVVAINQLRKSLNGETQ